MTETDVAALFAPGRVLAYGGGAYAERQVPAMLDSKINVVGVIDQSKAGTLALGGHDLPLFSIAEARERFGPDVAIVLTVADRNGLHGEIRRDLAAAGFDAGRVLAYDDLADWLTVPSDKCYCYPLFRQMVLSGPSLYACTACCLRDCVGQPTLLCRFSEGRDPAQVAQEAVDSMLRIHRQLLRGRIPQRCQGCKFLTDDPVPDRIRDTGIGIGTEFGCNLACVYCYNADNEETPQVVARDYEKGMALLCALMDALAGNGLLGESFVLQLAAGELALCPRNDALLRVLRERHCAVGVVSNATIRSGFIDELLSMDSRNFLRCDLDAGTRETYLLVKGLDLFDAAVANLEHYRQVCGDIRMKYIVMPGLNTGDADYQGQIGILRRLRLNAITLSRDVERQMSGYGLRRLYYETGRFKAMLERSGVAVSLSLFYPHEQRLVDRFCKQFRRMHEEKDGRQA